MAAPLITLHDIRLTFGGTPLLTGADLNITPGDRICLVGRNGSGKSTLLKIAAGLVDIDSGERFCHPDAAIRYLPQEADFSSYKTTREAAQAGMHPTDDIYKAQMLLEELGLTGDEDTTNLSGGEARRTALVQALVSRPDVLLLDEPTNHLDIAAIAWLEKRLSSLKAAIVLISHDRRFLENMSRATVWLDRGKTRRLEQSFKAFENWRDNLIETEEKTSHKMDRKIAREEQWMYSGGVTGRRKRNMRRVSLLHQMRDQRSKRRLVQGNVKLDVAEGPASARLISEALRISKSYGDTPIVTDFSTRILRGDRVGIIGRNGAGKTTLLNMLTGVLAPDTGRVRNGKNMLMVTLDQKRETLNLEATVSETLTGSNSDQVIVNDKPRHVIGYMKDFLFSPEQVRSPVSVLSGGERCRLMLARALARPSNVLVLDEPTNDLDLETLDLLEEMLADYDGTVIVVSHDRDFLDRIVTSVMVSEGDGAWQEYAGGYTDMLAQRHAGAPVTTTASTAQSSKSAGPADKAPEKRAKDRRSGKSTRPAGDVAAAPRRKLSFKEKYALENLPGEIEALQKEIAILEKKMLDSDLYVRDRNAFDTCSARLPAATAELQSKEELWLSLEMKREEIEG